MLLKLEVPIQEISVRRLKLISWSRSREGRVKLNVDGSCRGNLGSCGRGGVMRNDRGKFLTAFSTNFGIGTNNAAELKALTCGLLLCKELNFRNIAIECDLALVVLWLRNKSCTVWYL